MPSSVWPVRFWVEFPDPARTDDAVIYRCDLTWLTSRWRCLFGAGCPGIVADRPDDGCCTFGAHLTDAEDRNRVAAAASRLDEGSWQHRPAGWNDSLETEPLWLAVEGSGPPDQPGDVEEDELREADPASEAGPAVTVLVDGACIFLNRPGFAGGAGCALHQLALRTGQSIVTTKPEVCWQVPIRRHYEYPESPDDQSRQVVCIGEFDRAAWGPGGHDLDWYCTREPVAHTATTPLYVSAREELVALMGAPAYARLAELAADFTAGRAVGHGVTSASDRL